MVEENDQISPPPRNHISSNWMPDSPGNQAGGSDAIGKASEGKPTAEDLQSAKLEALGRLAAGIAHEINTPAQFVGDHLKFIQDSINEILKGPASVYIPDYIKDNLPVAIKNTIVGVNRIGNIVGTMRRFSHKGLDKKKELGNVNQAIQDALVLSKAELDKNIVDLRFSLGKDIPEINCALSEVSHVILSLIVNAYDSIVDNVKHGQKGTITIRSSASPDGVNIEVRDNGGGIPDTIRDRIFEPFFTTKPVGQGMGQGLALAHAVIVAEHGGKLVFETELGKGSSFEIFLPLDPELDQA
jgi:two-component system NtrC family sensor kinase